MGITCRDLSGEICLKLTQYPKLTCRGEKRHFKPYAAKLFASIFHSFEAEIANAISSIK